MHIHGLGSSRAGTLRGVQIASELGLTSLVTTYRNTVDGPQVGSRRSTLGIDEFHDAEPALEFAIEHGAEQIVLFGWSMGASIALRLAHHSPWSNRV
ncbi:MAG: alpha/beta hydrolase family protein, partial [Pseudoclavibacter sp.]